MGVSMSRPFLRPSPNIPELGLMVGSMETGMPMSAQISGFQSRVSMFISMVREALVTSVACTPPVAPPVRFHSTQLSMVPMRSSPASARSRAPFTFSSTQATFGPAK